MANKIKAIAKTETRLYETEDAKKRIDIFSKEVEGWIDNTQNIESKRVLFHYPLFLADGENTKEAYVNLTDLKITDPLEEPSEDTPTTSNSEFEEANLTEEEAEIFQENIEKHSKPIDGNYFDETEDPYKGTEYEGLDPYQRQLKRFEIHPIVRLKPKTVLDLNNVRLGHLPNEYYLISENGVTVIIRNKASLQTFKVLKTNLIGY